MTSIVEVLHRSMLCTTGRREVPKTAKENNESVNSAVRLMAASHGLNHSYDSLLPILYPSIISEFNLSYGSVGMLVMGYRLTAGGLQIMMGFLGRFVRRKILLGVGMIWQSVANFLTAGTQGFEQILTMRTLAGVGSSPQHPIASSYIAENFSRRRLGKAIGVNIAAGQIGSFITPLAATLLLSLVGWRGTILAFSVPGMLVGIMFLFILESKQSLVPYDAASLSVLVKDMREVLRSRPILAVMAVQTVMAFRIGAGDFLPLYFGRDLGMTSLEVGVLYTIFLASGVPAPYFWGYLSDKFERRRVVMLAMVLASALWFILPYSRNNFQLIPVVVMLGFVTVGVGGVVLAIVADRSGHVSRDVSYGMLFTIAFALGSFAPFILGSLADAYGFQTSFMYVALISVSSVVAAYFLK